MDVRIVDRNQNQTPIREANVFEGTRRNALCVALINVSGDIYNAGGGGGSGGDGAINDGADSNLKATVKDYANANPLAVVLTNVSGDVYNALGSTSGGDGAIQDGANNSIEATVRDYTNSNPLAVALTNASGDVYNAFAGQDLYVNQRGAWASRVTGDVILEQNSNRIIGRIESPLGVELVGTRVGQFGVTGDVATTQRGAQGTAITGDGGVSATVRDYSNSNPIAVVLTNASGDTYNPYPKNPILTTVSGRVTSAGSNSIVAASGGRKIKVVSYDLQGDGDNSRGFFASGASGSQLTPEWELASREGVAKQVAGMNGSYIFSTAVGGALSFESSSARAMKYSVTYHSEDAN